MYAILNVSIIFPNTNARSQSMSTKIKILNLIRHPKVKNIWGVASNILIKVFGTKFAARLTLTGSDYSQIKPNSDIVLCISRDYFSKDIEQLNKRSKYSYLELKGGFTRFQESWLHKSARLQTYYQRRLYFLGNNPVNKSTDYARRIFNEISKKGRIVAVMSANIDYWQDTGFKLICKEMKVPFLSLSREHYTIPKSYVSNQKWFKDAEFRFEGSGVAVAGHQTEAILIESGACTKEQVRVTGFPRFDAWQEIDRNKPLEKREYITLMTYSQGYYADDQFKEAYRLFIESAKEHENKSDVKFLVKAKNLDDHHYLKTIFKGELPSNVKISYQIPLFEILPKSRLVIGFNSLSLGDALIANANIIVPKWGSCDRDPHELILSPEDELNKKIIDFTPSPEAFKASIAKAANGEFDTIDKKSNLKVLNKLFYFPETGTISQKVEDFITEKFKKINE